MLVIVSHDAGGAEILSSWAVRQDEPFLLVLGGPALKVFERKLGKVEVLDLEQALEKADWVLTGTSWQSDMENDAIALARTLQKKSVYFLDHWVNYRQRFEVDGELQLPDEIWVGDKNAYRLAQEIFIGATVCLKANPYLEGAVVSNQCVLARRSSIGNNVFVGTNSMIREHVTVGEGASVMAGSVVIKDVAKGASVSGNFATDHRGRMIDFVRGEKIKP